MIQGESHRHTSHSQGAMRMTVDTSHNPVTLRLLITYSPS